MEHNKCLKCGSDELVQVPLVPGDEPHIAVSGRGLHQVAITRCVCINCGFIEQWVDRHEDLKRLKQEYGPPRATSEAQSLSVRG